MTMMAFDVSADLFVRGLGNLKGILGKGEAHAVSRGLEPGALLGARLAGDMYDLATQVHWAADGAKLALDRLFGVTGAPAAAEPATSFAELQARIDAVIAHLRAVDPAALEARLEHTVEIPYRSGPRSFRGDRFLVEFAIPNFYFHLTTAYAILRHEGVPLQKGDFMGA
jgi:hypothetical protein